MSFAEATWLTGLAGLPFLALGLWLVERGRRRRLARLAHPRSAARIDLSAGGPGAWLRGTLILLAVAMVLTALARPRWGVEEREVAVRGLDLVIALDLSRSMLAEDIAPSRLVVARDVAGRIAEQLASDRVGLVGFTAQAALLCPLTFDRAALALYLDAASPDLFSAQGSDLGAAIRRATDVLKAGGRQRRVLVVLSDGEDHGEGAIEAAQAAAAEGITIYAVGVGLSDGEPIPLRSEDGAIRGYMKDDEGRPVSTRLNDTLLSAVARAGGGAFVRATGFGEGARRIVQSLEAMDREELAETLAARQAERYRWPLFAALVFAFLEAALVRRRRAEELL